MTDKVKKLVKYSLIIFAIVAFVTVPLPFYVYQPGTVDSLHEVVNIENSYTGEGELNLVTVRGGRATPLLAMTTFFSSYRDLLPIGDVFPDGYDRDQYMQAQLQMMESSQEAAIVVAYQEANEAIDVYYEGVYVVSTMDDLPASEKLEIADKIMEVEGQRIDDADHLIEIVSQYDIGDHLTFVIERDEQMFEETIELVPLPDEPQRPGIGIQLVTNREISIERDVQFDSGEIGGPSAGIVLSLEIYNQLTETDLTNGLKIAGTGEIDYEGNVHRIGGVDKKVVASDREDVDIFFVPNDGGTNESNYELAMATKASIDSDMEIVPIDTVSDAIEFLLNYEA
ncbi:PDZ domain-containing protein [Pelagirhabdus alkalitolerans]|uniref:endopeptidase La n=1 Tax=Pelagirhabdus alkalitolerans TaxID=1612202 RepID=A0A1G6H0H2_9BACI|nr:SepM family pheromone-processing serine protease [Pelagirhabdus alkalitolerans]SDB87435.1 PDZ domain-containing protein [Pelagirhabdus alkalitolerans]